MVAQKEVSFDFNALRGMIHGCTTLTQRAAAAFRLCLLHPTDGISNNLRYKTVSDVSPGRWQIFVRWDGAEGWMCRSRRRTTQCGRGVQIRCPTCGRTLAAGASATPRLFPVSSCVAIAIVADIKSKESAQSSESTTTLFRCATLANRVLQATASSAFVTSIKLNRTAYVVALARCLR